MKERGGREIIRYVMEGRKKRAIMRYVIEDEAERERASKQVKGRRPVRMSLFVLFGVHLPWVGTAVVGI